MLKLASTMPSRQIEELQRRLGATFRDPRLLQQALVHSSFVNEMPSSSQNSNERLEFLGDAVIGSVIAERLYKDYPDLNEGQLTHLRSSLVKTETLAETARSLGLGEHIVLGRGEETGGGREKPRNLAAAFEALVGAMLLDGGVAKTRAFVLRCMKDQLASLAARPTSIDPKSRLQQVAQDHRRNAPVYRLASASGPDHAKTFEITVELDGAVLGSGTGRSKKEAEQRAASAALRELGT